MQLSKNLKIFIFRTIQKVGYFLGIDIHISKLSSKKKSAYRRSGKNLNIGCGRYIIDGFISLDIYTEHYHRNRQKDFIEYDLRSDGLPFENNSIDNIYISHVIEHVETKFVEKFVLESYRVLRLGGTLRLACPDAEFLYEVSSFSNEYWSWRQGWFQGKNARQLEDIPSPNQIDFFIREISTPRSKFYINRITKLEKDGTEMLDLPYELICKELTSGLSFRKEYPGDHINAWDFSRLRDWGKNVGFRKIIRSKPGGSVSLAMQGPDMDLTHPQMSLYVDMVK